MVTQSKFNALLAVNEVPEDRLKLAREYAAKINWKLADTALDDDFGFASHVTRDDKLRYAEEQRIYAKEIEAGVHDGNFTILQRMNYYLTGECVALLPK